jgi:hypothetical protein
MMEVFVMQKNVTGLEWPYYRTLLPVDLDLQARMTKALIRARGVVNAEALVRMFLVYGITRQPLKGVVAWAKAAGIADMSAPAFFGRLQSASSLLEKLIAEVLSGTLHGLPGQNGYRLRIVDATAICGPGAKGIDWRVHVLIDPASGRLASVEVTDVHGGEKLGRHPIADADLVLGDRGYARAPGIAAVTRQGAALLVRVNTGAIRLCDSNKQPVDLKRIEVPPLGAKELNLLMPEPPEDRDKNKPWPLKQANSWIPVRLIGARPKDSSKPIWLLCTAPQERLSALEALDLYRLRWQVEMLFKRLKSILGLNELPARTEPIARTWLLSRLLAAAMIERMTYENSPFSPWGYRIRTS